MAVCGADSLYSDWRTHSVVAKSDTREATDRMAVVHTLLSVHDSTTPLIHVSRPLILRLCRVVRTAEWCSSC